jgi:transmembrane sensor
MIKLLPNGYEMLNKEHAYYLLQKLMDGQATAAERATLSQLLKQDYDKEHWIELFEELYHAQAETEQPVYDETTWKPVLEELLQNVRVHNPKVIPMWRKWAVAASVLFVVGLATFYVISNRSERHPELVSGPTTHDVFAPDKNRAQIKLSDGTIVYLDSAANGQLVNVNGVQVTKTADGQIVYDAVTLSGVEGPTAVTYNTLSNPRGSIVMHMTLSDGSHVWLNAGSTITYPVAFTGNERKVTMTGEAYYEIAPAFKPGTKEKQSFLVEANGTTTEVLGTHFNVNAYNDEADTKITLLEGSVKVSNDVDAKIIKPGQQAVVILSLSKGHSRLTIHDNIDLPSIIAWKSGLFEFNNAELPVILRQIARWYDVEIIYQSNPSHEKFGGGISNNLPLSSVLKLLEANGAKFKLEGNKLTVLK